uniref:Uncharacterized protein n=1 Tax=Arundo donax TaxID=35708 RepID=A0A0A9E1B7_ARUDO
MLNATSHNLVIFVSASEYSISMPVNIIGIVQCDIEMC